MIRIEHSGIKNPNWQAATCWLLINVAEDLKSGWPWKNPASGQSGTRTRNCACGIASLTCCPLDHAACCGLQKVFKLKSLPALHPIARSEKKKKLFILFYLFYRQNIPRVRRLQANIFGLVRQIHQASPIYSYQLPHLQSRYMKIAPNSS